MVYSNNFRFGEISKRNAGRFDTEAYPQGSFSFLNAMSLTEGGATRRPPLKNIYPDSYDISTMYRLIPFTVSESISLIIGLGKTQIALFRMVDGELRFASSVDYPEVISKGYSVSMNESIAKGATYAQYYERMYFASQEFRPFYIDLNTATMTITPAFMSVILNQDAKKRIMFTPSIVRDSDGNELTDQEGRYLFLANDGNYYFDEELTQKYEYSATYPPVYGSSTYISDYDTYEDDDLLMTANDYPAVVAIVSDSIWFASTRNNPATIWKSRILGSSQWIDGYISDSMHDFTQFQQVVTSSKDVVDNDEIPMTEATDSNGAVVYELDENGNTKWFACKSVNGEVEYICRLYRNYKADGGLTDKNFYTSPTEFDSSTIYAFGVDEYAGNKPYMVYDLSDSTALVKTVTTVDFVTTDSCAMRFSMNTGRNDRVTYIKSAMEKIIVGTTVGEEMLNTDFSPTGATRSHYSDFGSLRTQPVMLNTSMVFLQRDNILRELYLYEGYVNNGDITQYSKGILDGTVRAMVAKNTPYPNIYLLMEDGSMRVLTYDKNAGVQAFSRWTFTDISVKSISTIEHGESQTVVALCDVGGEMMLCSFDESESKSFADLGTHQYTTEIETVYAEIVDNSLSFGRYKKARVMWLRPYDTGHMMIGNDRRQLTQTRHKLGYDDYRHTIMGAPASQFSMVMQSVDDEPMTILAMAWEVDNGS